MAKTQDHNLERSLGFLAHDVSRLMRKAFDRRVAALGLTRSQWRVLAYVYRDQGLTQSGLADVLDVGKVTLGGLVDRLEAKGWIERRPDERDRRIKRIYLKPDAGPVIQSMRAPAQELYATVMDGLSASQQECLIDMLLLLKSNLLADDLAPVERDVASIEN
jgi:DNA-binding MarR family transcriptional regulator